ncbi:MAG: hypothetical protein EOM84_02970 [Sphingobacteriia bacterium]|nr:hypothetical protein [Sphingobacteriia bacterium]
MDFRVGRDYFKMLAYIDNIPSNCKVPLTVKLLKNGEEVYRERYEAFVQIEKHCSGCGRNLFDEESLSVRVQNFIDYKEGGQKEIFIKLKTVCSCKKKKSVEISLSGEKFSDFMK